MIDYNNDYYNRKIDRMVFSNKKRIKSLCRSLADEQLEFLDGEELGSLCLTDEKGTTVRKVRRILEKRVYQNYWRTVRYIELGSNKNKAAVQKYMSRINRNILRVAN